MNDLARLERLIADVAAEAAGPSRPVDVVAITRAASTQPPQWRVQPMFSATKFVVAGVIVALFGGFGLAGVLTQRPAVLPVPAVTTTASPAASASVDPSSTPTSSITTDLLPGVNLVTQEVEPGVSLIVSDGVRDLAWDPGPEDPTAGTATYYRYYRSGIALGPHGIAWIFRPDGYFLLGDRLTYQRKDGEPRPRGPVAVVSANANELRGGTVWWADGQLWSFSPSPESMTDIMAWGSPGPGEHVAVNSAGSIWAVSQDLSGDITLSSSTGFGNDWTSLPYPGPDWSVWDLWVTDEDEVWTLEYVNEGGGHSRFRRFDGTTWEVVDVPSGPEVITADVGRDGTAWAWLKTGPGPDPDQPAALARYDARGWQTFDVSGEVPRTGYFHDGHTFLAAAPDGTAWYNASADGVSGEDQPACDGLVHFDGTTAIRYLRGSCIYNLAIAPDGTAWVLAGADYWDDPGLVDTYVITPEAKMATR